MNNIKSKVIISRYKEDFSWIQNYTDNYLVYNKGDRIENDIKINNIENIGGNQRDILKFCYEYYDNLPDLIAFVQGFPFDHCPEPYFSKLISNNFFTSIEHYGMIPNNNWELRDFLGNFSEINNSWYVDSHNNSHNQTCRYSSFDEFMNHYFENYIHLDWIRFCPGSQYIVEKERILYYPKDFWQQVMNELNSKTPTEGHIIERSLYMIFENRFKLKSL